jgi:hypothetical protein
MELTIFSPSQRLMKYHFQYVSKTTVRIQLIPEKPKEAELLSTLSPSAENSPELLSLFQHGLETYSTGATLTKTRFMDFPKVALCTFASPKSIENVA